MGHCQRASCCQQRTEVGDGGMGDLDDGQGMLLDVAAPPAAEAVEPPQEEAPHFLERIGLM